MIWRKSTATHEITTVLSDGHWHYGLDLMRSARVRAGLLYRVLGDLEASGMVEAAWDEGSHPRRRRYRAVERLGLKRGDILRDGRPTT
jgi:DNA-binding PadR family transcriptional regulator